MLDETFGADGVLPGFEGGMSESRARCKFLGKRGDEEVMLICDSVGLDRCQVFRCTRVRSRGRGWVIDAEAVLKTQPMTGCIKSDRADFFVYILALGRDEVLLQVLLVTVKVCKHHYLAEVRKPSSVTSHRSMLC